MLKLDLRALKEVHVVGHTTIVSGGKYAVSGVTRHGPFIIELHACVVSSTRCEDASDFSGTVELMISCVTHS